MTDEAHELQLYIVNDGDLYRQRRQPIEANLQKKMEKGTYDPKKAEKLWGYLADDGAKKYAKEFGSASEWNRMFTPAVRREAAAAMARDFEAEAKVQGYYRMNNPHRELKALKNKLLR